MKNLFFVLLIFSFNLRASVSIVSDLDDTIKITNSGRAVNGTINAVFSGRIFTGMSEFFKAAEAYSNELHILSASPLLLRGKIFRTLRKHEIEIASLTLRNLLNGQSKLAYKVEELKRIFEASADDFILIGDDVGQDPEAYAEIQRLFPERVLAIYIHVVSARKIPSEGFRYWTSFDLFLKEYLAGRLSSIDVVESASLILEEERFSSIIPGFADCPVSISVWSWQLSTAFSAEAASIMDLISSRCEARNSGIRLQ